MSRDWKFIQTANVRNLTGAMNALMNRPPKTPGLAVVHGPAGRGKTESAIWYCGNRGGRYLVANPLWTPRWMLCDLYAVLKGLKTANFTSAKAAFWECHQLMKTDSLPVFIDEADQIAHKLPLLEALRNLVDGTGTPIVCVGTDQIFVQLQQREQFASRVYQVVTFEALCLDEVKMAAAELGGLNLDDAAAKALLEACGGYFRDLVVALGILVQAATASGTKEPDAKMVQGLSRRVMRAMLRAA